MKHLSMIGDSTIHDIIKRKDMIVEHLEMTAVVIEAFACIPVVGGIDVYSIVEHVGRRVCHKVLWKKVSWFHVFLVFSFWFF